MNNHIRVWGVIYLINILMFVFMYYMMKATLTSVDVFVAALR